MLQVQLLAVFHGGFSFHFFLLIFILLIYFLYKMRVWHFILWRQSRAGALKSFNGENNQRQHSNKSWPWQAL